MRYVLKHLRQRRFLGPYNAILARCGLQVEDPLVTELHESVVLQGNWASAEQIVQHISQTDLFDEYRHSKQARSLWRRLSGKDANGDVPSPRGGHAMCVDPVGGMIYLFGGWDGKKSLADFWEYDIKQDKWHVLSYDTAKDDNAPGARSCHKMVFDTRTGHIYVLGRLDDADAQKFDSAPPPGDAPPPAPAAKTGPEFYRYQTRGSSSGKWELLSADPQVRLYPLLYLARFSELPARRLRTPRRLSTTIKWSWIARHKSCTSTAVGSSTVTGRMPSTRGCIATMSA